VKEYLFKLFLGEALSGEGYGCGNNALEAFETGIEQGSVIIPNGQEIEVLAILSSGLGFRFTAYKQ